MPSTSIADIVALLQSASDAYYNGATPIMDDDSYDALLGRLKELAPNHPYLETVGAPVAQGGTALPYAMPSLDKIKPGQDQLTRFLANAGGFVLSEKLDGLSALWIPASKKLYLRGDGITGQDVSHLVGLGIQGLKSAVRGTAVRGELILPRSEGQALGRSWVNGQIHQTTPDPALISKIHFVAYELVAGLEAPRSKQLQWLVTAGFELPWYSVMNAVSEGELMTILQKRRIGSPYDTDGIVVGLDSVPRNESTKTKAKNPKDCVAFKMPLADQSAETTVREVIWSPSAQGYLIPRIRFDTVEIGAATIEFCTGHNARMIATERVGPGARVVIRRSGDVIPKLDKVLVASEAISFPPTGTWEWIGDAATAVHIKPVGDSTAAAQAAAKLHYFLKTLDIPGSGPATAAALVAAKVLGPAALWALNGTELSTILGPKTGASLYANLRTRLASVDEMTLMHASSMMPRGVGDTKLGSLFAAVPDPRNWTTAVAPPTGWTTDSYRVFLAEFPAYVAWRAKELHWIPYPIGAKLATGIAPPTNGETICMTGFRDKELEAAATQKGFAFTPTFTGKVTILLVADGPLKESEKVKAARAKGTKILTRSQFVAQYLS